MKSLHWRTFSTAYISHTSVYIGDIKQKFTQFVAQYSYISPYISVNTNVFNMRLVDYESVHLPTNQHPECVKIVYSCEYISSAFSSTKHFFSVFAWRWKYARHQNIFFIQIRMNWCGRNWPACCIHIDYLVFYQQTTLNHSNCVHRTLPLSIPHLSGEHKKTTKNDDDDDGDEMEIKRMRVYWWWDCRFYS